MRFFYNFELQKTEAMKLLLKILILLVINASAFSQESKFVIKGNIKNIYNPTTVYLLAIEGSKWDVVDSMKSQKGEVFFSRNEIPETGEYYISWNDDKFLNIVINNENLISFTADNLEPDLDVKIIESEENKIFYKLKGFENTIDSLSEKGDEYYEKGLTTQMQKIKHLISETITAIEDTLVFLEKQHKNSFAVKIYKSSIPPSFKKYCLQNPDNEYKSEYDFLKRHYFDNIDKNDSCLVNSRVLYDACSFYLRTFTEVKNTENYIKTANFIISSFSWNNKQFDYVLNLLLNTFEAASFDDVFIYLFNTYMHSAICDGEIPGETERKAMSMQKLKKGSVAPELSGFDRFGKKISLSDYKGKTVLLMFWESSCPHCRKAIPYVLELLKSKPNIVVLSFSIDTNEQKWIGGILEEQLPEPSISDLKGFDGQNAINWYLWGTPAFFVINPEGIIIAKPLTLKALEEVLE
jgi:thiol-disulfide isomerase/thioredoxin